jgi:hypothetical protein
MSEREMSDRVAGKDWDAAPMESPSMAGAPHALPGPHFPRQPAEVLARMPDLESADCELADQGPRRNWDGRILSSRLSVKILAGGALLLVLAAVFLPMLIGGSDSSDPGSNDGSSRWQPQVPAPSASLAPSWDATSGEVSDWTATGEANGFPPSGSVPISAPTGEPYSSQWSAGQQTQSGANPMQGRQWPDRSEAGAWGGQPDIPPGANLPAWEAPSSRPSGFARDPQAASPNAAPIPSWQLQQYPVAGQGRSGLRGPADLAPSPYAGVEQRQSAAAAQRNPYVEPLLPDMPPSDQRAYDPNSPAADRYDSYRLPQSYGTPQAAMNRPMAIGQDRSPQPSASWTDPQRHDQPAYRAADARAATPPGTWAREDWPDRQDAPAATGGLPAGSPPFGHRSSSDPSAGQPPLSYRATDVPSPGQPPMDPSAAVLPGARYGAPAYPQQPEPGVARFRGGIEKPIESSMYERDRSGVY